MHKLTFKEHFIELKERFLKLFIVFWIIFGLCYYLSDHIYKIILIPLTEIDSNINRKIIYTGLTEAFFSYIKLSFFASVIIIFPVICYQIYAFIVPGLYKNEKKLVLFILLLSPILFYSGCFFMYFIIMPNAWQFFSSYETVKLGIPLVLEARISEYLDLVIQLTLAFGMSFQLPIIVILLSLFGFVKAENLRRKRRFAVVVIFIAAAVFTPPDVFSQIALAIPLLLLYEISILSCELLEKRTLNHAGH